MICPLKLYRRAAERSPKKYRLSNLQTFPSAFDIFEEINNNESNENKKIAGVKNGQKG